MALEVMAYLEEKTVSNRITVSHVKGAFKTNKKKCAPSALLIRVVVDDAFAAAVILPWFKKWKERNGLPEWKSTVTKRRYIEGVLTLVIPITEAQSKFISNLWILGKEYPYAQILRATPQVVTWI